MSFVKQTFVRRTSFFQPESFFIHQYDSILHWGESIPGGRGPFTKPHYNSTFVCSYSRQFLNDKCNDQLFTFNAMWVTFRFQSVSNNALFSNFLKLLEHWRVVVLVMHCQELLSQYFDFFIIIISTTITTIIININTITNIIITFIIIKLNSIPSL